MKKLTVLLKVNSIANEKGSQDLKLGRPGSGITLCCLWKLSHSMATFTISNSFLGLLNFKAHLNETPNLHT